MSTEDQQYSLDNQQRTLGAYAELHGFSLVRTYILPRIVQAQTFYVVYLDLYVRIRQQSDESRSPHQWHHLHDRWQLGGRHQSRDWRNVQRADGELDIYGKRELYEPMYQPLATPFALFLYKSPFDRQPDHRGRRLRLCSLFIYDFERELGE
jgi:hypothetical protein